MSARRLDAAAAAGLGLASLALYWRTLAPSVLPADSGEFQFTSYLLSVAHPTCYPLYSLLGKLFTLLPIGDVAHRVSFASAVYAAAAVSVLYLLGVGLHRDPNPAQRTGAALGAALFAVGALWWSQAVVTEVYTLNVLLFGLALWALLRPAALAGEDRNALPLAGLALGLGLAHHRSIVLLAPAVAWWVWRRRADVTRREVGLAALGLLAPLLLYLYIPLRAAASPYLRLVLSPSADLKVYDGSLPDFAAWVSGSAYSGSLHLGLDVLAGLPGALGLLAEQVTPLGLLLAPVGVVLLWRCHRDAAVVVSLTLVAVVAFCLVYRIGDIAPFYLPAVYLLTLCAGQMAREWGAPCPEAAGLTPSPTPTFAPSPAASGQGKRLSPLRIAPLVLLLPLALWLLVANYAPSDRSGLTFWRAEWQKVLALPLPPNAILVNDLRDPMMPLWYLQLVEGVRPDLLGLFPGLGKGPRYATLSGVADAALSSGRPVYLAHALPGLEARYEVDQAGPLPRLLGPAVPVGFAPGRAVTAVFGDEIRLIGADLPPAPAPSGTPLRATFYWEPLRAPAVDYKVFAHLVDATGSLVAQSDHVPGGPSYPPTRWLPGERLRDAHVLELPADLQAGEYLLRAGLYRPDGGKRLTVAETGTDFLTVGPLAIGPAAR